MHVDEMLFPTLKLIEGKFKGEIMPLFPKQHIMLFVSIEDLEVICYCSFKSVSCVQGRGSFRFD